MSPATTGTIGRLSGINFPSAAWQTDGWYAAAWRAARAMGYRKIVTYILDTESGASLRAAGWKCAGLAGGKRWTGSRRPAADLYPAQMKYRYEQSIDERSF